MATDLLWGPYLAEWRRRVAADGAKAAEDQEESSRLAGVVESALGGLPPDLIAG